MKKSNKDVAKKGKEKKVVIHHNKKLFWVIIVLIVLLIVLIWFIIKNDKLNKPSQNPNSECTKDRGCVPAACCHAESCVPVEDAPKCKGMMCSMVCSGPLDCDAGHCGCVKGKCEVIKKK